MVWNQDPILFQFDFLTIRWYGLYFAMAIFLAYVLAKKMNDFYSTVNINMDSLFNHIVIGTITGARVGHCLFYDPAFYLANPIKILFVWEGGLASHGALIGIFISILIFSKKYKINPLIISDLLAAPASQAGAFIRIGNFFNSEIVGSETSKPWGIIFSKIDQNPRHPTQLYEAFFYLIVFYLLINLYQRNDVRKSSGRITGIYLILIFSFRFGIEFLKLPQSQFESSMILNMGQLLSLPLIFAGAFIIYKSKLARPAQLSFPRFYNGSKIPKNR